MTADPSQHERFYKMSQMIAAEMNDDTGALSFDKASTPQVLDLCMTPGGYSAAILRLNPTASIDGITLPPGDGGYEALLPYGSANSRVCVVFTDITMLATEYGVDMKEVPTDHPDVQKLTSLRPYQDKRYDLVLCDGLVLHGKKWDSYRDSCEATRLTNAQWILGLQRIKPGGTLIILLHKLDTFHSMMLVRSFCAFATVELFKPKRSDALRSSFYMVAKDVQPHSADAEVALTRYKSFWYNATFRRGAGSGEAADRDDKREDVKVVLEEFGPKLGELGRRIWII